MNALSRFVRDEAAATAIEYGLIASLISVALIVAVEGVGTSLNATYSLIANAIK